MDKQDIAAAVQGLTDAEVEALLESTAVFMAIPRRDPAPRSARLQVCEHDEANSYKVLLTWQLSA